MLAVAALTALTAITTVSATAPRRAEPPGLIDPWRQYSSPGSVDGAVRGPDGAMWVADSNNDLLLRYGPDGTFSTMSVAPYSPLQMVVGSDGAFYCSLLTGDKGLLRVTLAGQKKFFPIVGHGQFDVPYALTLGTDGNVWFSEQSVGPGRVTPSGVVTEYGIVPENGVGGRYEPLADGGIAQDANGQVWFVAKGPCCWYIGRLNPSNGRTTLFAPGTCAAGGGVVAGPDGAMWLQCGNGLGRITNSGSLTQYPMPPGLLPGWPQGLAFDARGRLWSAATIVKGSYAVGGSFVEFDLTTHAFKRHDFPWNDVPFTIAIAADGSIWATTKGLPQIVELIR